MVLLLTLACTALSLLLKLVQSSTLKFLLNCVAYIIIACPALAAYKIQGGNIKQLFSKKGKSQFAAAAIIFAVLSFVIAIVPALFGFSIIGDAMQFDIGTFIRNAIFYILFVGPVEEFIFRIYVQETLQNLFTKHKWLAPLLAALLFGLWHFLNGSLMQVIFTFLIGLVFGYTRYFSKSCTYITLSLSHGCYDFFNVVVRMFIL